MKKIFKVGDTVYHWDYGKGEITDTSTPINKTYPIKVNFQNISQITFTKDGRYSEEEPPSLSFTPYDLVKGGFSQERLKLKLIL